MPSAHAKLSPSGSSRWMECPGAPAAEVGMPDTSSASADDGTLKHALAEKCLRLKKWKAAFYLGDTLTVKHGESTITGKVTQAMADAVQPCLNFVKSYLAAHPDAQLYVEQEVDIGKAFGLPVNPETGKTDYWGTSDLFILTAVELVVCDWKFGFHTVSVTGNRQLSGYGIGFEHENNVFSFEQVRLVIVQPQVSDEPQEEVIGIDELRRRHEEYMPKVKAALQPNAPRVPGDQCRFCKAAAGKCPELQAQSLRVAQAEFAEPEALPIATVVEVLEQADTIKSHLKACEAFAKRMLEVGQPVPGWKLVKSRKNRVWKDWKAALKTLLKLGHKMEACHTEPEPISPAQAEKLVGKGGKEVLAKFIETPEGEPVLAPESDSRPAVTPDFEAIA